MAGFQNVFKRVELKYLLQPDQYETLRRELEPMAAVDAYGETEILNIYYDTPDRRLIRDSLDKPRYKEKLRLRTYGTPRDDSPAFVEIKKKFEGIVYKRRIQVPYLQALQYLNEDVPLPESSQISGEIDYFKQVHRPLLPSMMIAYDRIALAGREDPDLRITFDQNIRWRTDHLDLRLGGIGRQLLEPGQVLMELKIAGGMPLELADILCRLGIFQTSFSKYGRGYADEMKLHPQILLHRTWMSRLKAAEAGTAESAEAVRVS